jgi:hypothetical protein
MLRMRGIRVHERLSNKSYLKHFQKVLEKCLAGVRRVLNILAVGVPKYVYLLTAVHFTVDIFWFGRLRKRGWHKVPLLEPPPSQEPTFGGNSVVHIKTSPKSFCKFYQLC